MIRCCYKCEDRTATCHSTCEKYAAESAAHAEEKRKAIAERRPASMANSVKSSRRLKYYQRHKNREVVKFNRGY